MRIPQTLVFARVESSKQFVDTNAYNFKPSKLPWLAKLAWKLLHRLKALSLYHHPIRVYKYTPDEQVKVTEALREQLDCLTTAEQFRNARIIMGAADFDELLHHKFSQPAELMTGELRIKENGMTFYRNIPIHVVPNVKGVAVICLNHRDTTRHVPYTA